MRKSLQGHAFILTYMQQFRVHFPLVHTVCLMTRKTSALTNDHAAKLHFWGSDPTCSIWRKLAC